MLYCVTGVTTETQTISAVQTSYFAVMIMTPTLSLLCNLLTELASPFVYGLDAFRSDSVGDTCHDETAPRKSHDTHPFSHDPARRTSLKCELEESFVSEENQDLLTQGIDELPFDREVINCEQIEGTTCNPVLVEYEDGKKGIFKPISSEGQNADYSPLKRGVTLGETAIKEVAAYLLGGAHLNVPCTQLLSTNIDAQEKFGSFQQYIPHSCSAEDMGCSVFPIENVQQIGILDVRLLNLDRHLNNLLVVKSENGHRLIPIDHGYSFPSYKDLSDVYFGWTYFPQCKQPWTDKAKEIIATIDPMLDAQKLVNLGVSSDSTVASVFSTLLLQYSAKNDIFLFRLAVFMQGTVDNQISGFEKALHSAISTTDPTFDFSNVDELPHVEWSRLLQTFFASVEEEI